MTQLSSPRAKCYPPGIANLPQTAVVDIGPSSGALDITKKMTISESGSDIDLVSVGCPPICYGASVSL